MIIGGELHRAKEGLKEVAMLWTFGTVRLKLGLEAGRYERGEGNSIQKSKRKSSEARMGLACLQRTVEIPLDQGVGSSHLQSTYSGYISCT